MFFTLSALFASQNVKNASLTGRGTVVGLHLGTVCIIFLTVCRFSTIYFSFSEFHSRSRSRL